MNKLIVIPLLFFILFSSSAFALTLNYPYILADSYVLSSHPTTNYGTSYWLSIQGGAGAGRSYLKFNITPATLTALTSANLSIYINGWFTGGTGQILVYNTSLNYTETNITWNVIPTTDELQYNQTHTFTTKNVTAEFNVTDAVISALQQGQTQVSFLVRVNDETTTNGFIGYSRNYTDTSLRPYLTLYYGGGTSEPCVDTSAYFSGTTCLSSAEDSSRRGYVTVSDDLCYLNYSSCPTGTLCSQFTSTAERNDYYNTSWAVNWTVNTVGCLNLTTGYILSNCINQNGDTVLCQDITTTNTTFPPTCVNTSTTCYNSGCQLVGTSATACYPAGVPIADVGSNPMGYIASWTGSLFGIKDQTTAFAVAAIVFTLLLSTLLVVTLSFYDIGGNFIGTIFIMSAFLLLLMFTLVGWFPTWLIVIMIVIASLGIAGKISGLVGG